MDSPAARLAAALLAQNPGAAITERGSHALVVSLPLGSVRATVVLLEVAESGPALEARVKALVEQAVMGQPLHVVLVHGPALDVRAALEAQIKPTGLQMKQVGGWSWVPGGKAVSVRGPSVGALVAAADHANATPGLSLENVTVEVEAEAGRVGQFHGALMARPALVSWAIAGVCVVFFGLQYGWGGGLPILAASRMGAEIPSRVLAGEWWRLFSVMLLHANIFHLAMNMLALLSFGPFLERLIGSGRYLALYVLSGLGGALLSLTRGGDGIGVGASGGVWGLMVAGAVAVTWPRGLLPASLAHQLRQRAWTPVVINLLYSLQPGIDLLAHLGGGLSGGLLLFLLNRGGTGTEPLKRSPALSALGGLMGLALAASMGLALWQGKPWELTGTWTLEPVALEGTGLHVDVPTALRRVPDDKAGRWRWGDINDEGVGLVVVVTELLPEDEDLTGAPDVMMEELQKPPEGLHFGQKPRKVTLPSGQEAVFVELVPDDADDARFVWQWWTLEQGPRWVMVLANALKTTSEERKQQLLQIADSVK
jgi:rhomboid protease GluP